MSAASKTHAKSGTRDDIFLFSQSGSQPEAVDHSI